MAKEISFKDIFSSGGHVVHLINFGRRHYEDYDSGPYIGLWIVRQVAIRSDPRFMSYDSQIELRVTG